MQKIAHILHGLKYGAIFLLIGLAIMGGSVYSAYRTATRVKTVAAWPTTPAYVIESRIEWTVEGSDHAGSRQRSYAYYFRLSVLAGYRIDGEYYTSATPAIKTIRGFKLIRDPKKSPAGRDMVTLFKQVPSGAVVPIHYNPADKGEAYIFSELPFWRLYFTNVLFFLFGILPLLFGLVLMPLRQFTQRMSGQETLSE